MVAMVVGPAEGLVEVGAIILQIGDTELRTNLTPKGISALDSKIEQSGGLFDHVLANNIALVIGVSIACVLATAVLDHGALTV